MRTATSSNKQRVGQRPVSCCEMTRLLCGLLRRLRSAIPLGDNLGSSEVVIDPIMAFGYVVSDIRKGAFLPDEGKMVSATGKVTHISTAYTP